jgi:hypothetical protein
LRRVFRCASQWRCHSARSGNPEDCLRQEGPTRGLLAWAWPAGTWDNTAPRPATPGTAPPAVPAAGRWPASRRAVTPQEPRPASSACCLPPEPLAVDGQSESAWRDFRKAPFPSQADHTTLEFRFRGQQTRPRRQRLLDPRGATS